MAGGGGPRPYQPRYAAAVAGGGGGGGHGGGQQQQHPRMPQHVMANNMRGIHPQGLFSAMPQQQGQQPVYTFNQQHATIMIGNVS